MGKVISFISIYILLQLSASAQSSQVASLIDMIQDSTKLQESSDRLQLLMASSPQTRCEVAAQLAKKLDDTSNLQTWRTDIGLVEHLHLIELAPTIAKSLDRDTRGGNHDMGGIHLRLSLDYDPAVKTLVSFGVAAVPYLATELSEGNRIGRYRAAHALSIIGGPQTEEILRSHYLVESDPGLKTVIGKRLNIPSEKRD